MKTRGVDCGVHGLRPFRISAIRRTALLAGRSAFLGCALALDLWCCDALLAQARPVVTLTASLGNECGAGVGTIDVDWVVTANQGEVSGTDWIGLYEVQALDHEYLSYRYTGGALSGKFAFWTPDFPGEYEFRYFLENGYTMVARSNSVAVGDRRMPGASLAAVPDQMLLECGGQLGTVTARWNVIENQPCVTSSDWIGLYAVGASNGEYRAWRYTDGTLSGEYIFSSPGEPGAYEFRYIVEAQEYIDVARSDPFTVRERTRLTATLTASPAAVGPGETIAVSWTVVEAAGCVSAADWIGLYAVGASNSSYLAWRYTGGNVSGEFAFAAPGDPGEYEFRYIADDADYIDVGRSNPFRVGQGATAVLALAASDVTCGRAEVEVLLTNLCDVEAVSFGIRHDPAALRPLDVEPSSVWGGSGPEFLAVNLDARSDEASCGEDVAGITVAMEGSKVDPARGVIAAGESRTIATIAYGILPIRPEVPGAELRFVECLLSGKDPHPDSPTPCAVRCGAGDASLQLISGDVSFVDCPFLRGDSDDDGAVGMDDALFTLGCLFQKKACPGCYDAADSNDDGGINVADPIHTLMWLFAGGKEPPPPGPTTCDQDPTPDSLKRCVRVTCGGGF